MTATDVEITVPPAGGLTERRPDVAAGGQAARNVIVMARRNLIHIGREPMQLSDVTIQPVLFTLLFVYVFGAGIVLPGGGNYKDFVIPGLMLLNLTTSTTGTAVGLCTDIHTGAIDRFRTLPLWRPSILVGRSLCDLLSSTVCLTIVTLTGLAVGWRPHTGLLSVLGGLGLGLLFAYAIAWAIGCIGLVSKGPESALAVGFLILFPLAFISNAMVATQRMPSLLRLIANWNPVSAVTAGLRVMFGDPNPSSTVHAWPMQHPVAASVAWSLVILAVAVPTAAHLFRSRTTG
jgi:ABC-2 type transport system permease protein